MGFSDITKLFRKENSLLTLLLIWLIVGITIFQFYQMPIIGNLLLLPLLVFCFIMFIVSLLFRGKNSRITELSGKNIARIVIIGFFVVIIFVVLGFFYFAQFWFYIFNFSLYSYIFIMGFYWISAVYDSGVDLDDKLAKSTSSFSIIIRWGIFLGGIGLSFLLLYYLVRAAHDYIVFTGTSLPAQEYEFLFMKLPPVIFWIIVVLSIIAGILILIGALNAWLGIFFPLSVIYIFFLMMQAIIRTDASPPTPIPGYKYLIIGMDIFLIIFTTASFLGKKAEKIDEKVSIISQDSILMWFFFAKASFEYADVALQGVMQINVLKTVGSFFVFIPLMVIAGVYGIIATIRKKKNRKTVKKRKKTMKTRK